MAEFVFPPGTQGLDAGLSAEYALIYAYGLAGPKLDGDEALALAARSELSHRDLRDALTEYMTSTAQPVPAPQAAYVADAQPADERAAAVLLAELEGKAAQVWRAVVGQTSGDNRRRAVQGLANAATQAMRWHEWLGTAAAGDAAVAKGRAFPGLA